MEITIDIAFKFGKQEAREDTLTIECPIPSFNCNMKPCHQSRNVLKFIKSKYHGRNLIKTIAITMKIFLEKSHGSYVTLVGK